MNFVGVFVLWRGGCAVFCSRGGGGNPILWTGGHLNDSRLPKTVYLMAHALVFNYSHEYVNGFWEARRSPCL